MRDAQPRLDAHDVHVVVIGNGRPRHAKMFREDERVPYTLWVDPDLVAYRAAGLRRGVGVVVGLSGFRNGMRALKAGHRQKATQGDPWQVGGVFVVTTEGRAVYEQRSASAGDHAPLHEILGALERLTA